MFMGWMILPVVIISDSHCLSTTMSVGNTTQCGNVTCNTGSKCVNKSCRCLVGYKGVTCHEDLDECENGDQPCFYRGHCYNTIGSYRCDCLQGWVPSGHCETPVSLADENRSCVTGHFGSWCNYTCYNDTMCGSNSHCKDLGSGKGQVCRCKTPSWHGVHPHCLDVDECARSQVCDNNGICVNTPGSFHCACAKGWTGDQCDQDVNECDSLPCNETSHTALMLTNVQDRKGICVNTPGSFHCACAEGWNGTLCELDIDECKLYPSHCKSFGRCVNVPGSFNCNCTDGWTGDQCDQDVNECDSLPCNETYCCINSPGSYICSLAVCSGENEASAVNIGLIVGTTCSVLGLASITTAVLLARYCWKRQRALKTSRNQVTDEAKDKMRN